MLVWCGNQTLAVSTGINSVFFAGLMVPGIWMVSFGLNPWLVVDLDWFPWLPLPGLWAGIYFVFLCPGCGLVLSMVGMLVGMLGSLSVGFGFGGFVSG